MSSGRDLGPVLLVGLGWLQVQGGPEVSAQPVNGWAQGVMQKDVLLSESAGWGERRFPPINFGKRGLRELLIHTPLAHPIFTGLFRTSTNASRLYFGNMDCHFKSCFSKPAFQKLVILMSPI